MAPPNFLQGQEEPFGIWNSPVIAVLILSLATLVVWANGCGGEFVWIDHVEIEQAGYRITSWDECKKVWTTSLDAYLERNQGELNTSGGYLRPVYAMSISLDWWLWQDRPAFYHLENLFWHLAVVLGLYFLGRRLFPNQNEIESIALIAAAIFALHPMNVHSVTWISGRKDTMCAAFSLVALIAFGKLMQDELTVWTRWVWRLTAVLSFALALFCKELALVAPAFATIWFWYSMPETKTKIDDEQKTLGALTSASRIQKGSLYILFSLWLTAFAAMGYRWIFLGRFGLNESHPDVSWLQQLSITCRLFATYIGGSLAPFQVTIVDRFRIAGDWNGFDSFAILLTLAVAIATLVMLARRWRAGLAFSWFLIWLLPASGLVPLRHLYAERYLYPASWGLWLMIVMMAFQWLQAKKQIRTTWLRMAFCLIAIVFAYLAIDGNRNWKSDRTLFEKAVAQNPDYVEGHSALALLDLDKQSYRESVEHSMKAESSLLDDSYQSYASPFGMYTNSGLGHFHLNQFDLALIQFEKAKLARPDNVISWFHLGMVHDTMQHSELAEKSYAKALQLNPDDVSSLNRLSLFYLRQRRFDECISLASRLLKNDPEHPGGLSSMGSALIATRKFRTAKPYFQSLVKLNPSADHLAKLAWCEFKTVETSEDLKRAQATLQLASEKDPENVVVRNVRALFGQ